MITLDEPLVNYLEASVIGRASSADAAIYAELRETHLLVLNVPRGWDGDLIAFIDAFAQAGVKRLNIFGQSGLDISSLERFDSLIELNVQGRLVGELNLDWFPNLKVFGCGAEIKGRQHIKLNWGRCSNLEFTGGAGSKLPSVETLASFPRLRKLVVVKPKFTPEELSVISSLRDIELSYWNSLTSFGQLGKLLGKLANLHLYSASKLIDYTPITEMKALKTLYLEKCPPIPSVTLIQGLPNLEQVYLIDMKITDGNLRPFYEMPKLTDAGLATFRHYSPSREELLKFINEKDVRHPMH